MVAPEYKISDYDFARFNNRRISFENLPVEETIASGVGQIKIQRSEGQGHGDIVVTPKGSEMRIHLRENLFKNINERTDDLFLEGGLI